jgi:hypothetical protein
MQRTQSGLAPPGTGSRDTDRAWVRWAVAAAVTGMLSWVAGAALIPLDAKLDKGNQHLAQVLRAHLAQGYAAALLAVLGAVLLAGFFAVLTRLVPQGHPGWGLLRVCMAGCVITQTLVAAGPLFLERHHVNKLALFHLEGGPISFMRRTKKLSVSTGHS